LILAAPLEKPSSAKHGFGAAESLARFDHRAGLDFLKVPRQSVHRLSLLSGGQTLMVCPTNFDGTQSRRTAVGFWAAPLFGPPPDFCFGRKNEWLSRQCRSPIDLVMR